MPKSKKTTAKAGGSGTGAARGDFAPELWKAARKKAGEYQIVLTHEAGEWFGRGLELPHVLGDGATPDGCVAATREALTAAVAYLLERGRIPPTPASNGRRSQQVNVRLTAEEKALLEGVARKNGYQGLSDYIRATVLESRQ